ncbi:OsmC family protein [Bdellovibrio bacteriovorus]|uniref:Osmotically inducible protein OsmC n=1 Tax=Bdellovibrio bacteriovorus TaxID=959 RepID=A0A150WC29_BDEBC|nr:OsmC family protein [Bdellovibrio bacteriovorus]KYG60595.1 osmotically inducible protein OsmC [Bdellovibrio bacteriovorus]
MVKMEAHYQGEKHCELTHVPSGARIGTDAPKDNNGKGELFSPTDLLGAATGSCMLTVMAIAADKDGVELKGSRVTVEKEMALNPRRVAKLHIVLHLPQSVPHDYRKKLEDIALNCPVKLSLHPDLQTPILFHYDI